MKNRFRHWSDIRVFLAVYREGSTLAASRILGMAQPTVARRIEALEHEIGVTLFLRDTRGFRPTDAAEALIGKAREIERAANAFSVKASDMVRLRPIRVTAYAPNLSGAVTGIFSAFSERRPDVQFEFIPSVRALDLSANEADVALRLTFNDPDPDLICRHVSTAQFTLYGARSYADQHGLPTSPETMAGHQLLAFRRDDVPTVFYTWFLNYVREDQIARFISEGGVLDAAIRAGQGLGLMNLRMAKPFEKAGELIRCFDPPKELSAPHVILVAPDAYERPEVRSFVKFFAPRYAALFKD